MTDYASKIATLEAAIASGELTVESDGDRVTYRSMAELMQARDYFAAQQAAAEGGSRRPATTLASYCPD